VSARRHERGSTLAETAIVMAVLLALLFGIIDFGRALYTYSFVAQLARQGARWAIVRGANCTALPTLPSGNGCIAASGTTDIEPYVQSLSEGATNASSIFASLAFPQAAGCGTPTGATNGAGCLAKVTVTYQFKFLLPYMPSGTLGTIPMSSTSEMVISN
jgi:Flp pilus assembly protein TadG